jgi:hypothetical protein
LCRFGVLGTPNLNMGFVRLTATQALGRAGLRKDLTDYGLQRKTLKSCCRWIVDLTRLDDFAGFRVHLGWSG